jgi:hypothetical protein
MQYQITINLSAATVDALKGVNSALYVLKSVRYGFAPQAKTPGFGGGYPLVWIKTASYAMTTSLSWTTALQAFISPTTPVTDGMVVTAAALTEADLGQIVTVSANGNLAVTTGGQGGTVSITNQGTTPWTCGLAATPGPAPVCAFPLYGGMTDMIAPVETVLLMFAPDVAPAGTAMSTAPAAGLLVQLSASAASRTVSFDINLGWSCGGGTWCSQVPAFSDLGSILILH